MQRIHLSLTEDDILQAQQDGFENTVLYLLSSTTGTLWRITECGIGLEIMAPHRVTKVCPEYRALWRQYKETGVLRPCELEMELSAPFANGDANDGASGDGQSRDYGNSDYEVSDRYSQQDAPHSSDGAHQYSD